MKHNTLLKKEQEKKIWMIELTRFGKAIGI
jgi:hypothetical protein